ncbi:MAG: VCBS repeat-containing protein, partial [Gemmatimonadetes bacterium]|nr:VCBS repeat-containing protein [Gemmatimonadota bacterium]
MGAGCAFFDCDGDGDLDLYAVNGAPLPEFVGNEMPTNRLYRNNGDGTFTDVTERAAVGDTGYGTGCTTGDYDNDGDLDLYVTNYGSNILYRNNGDGT